jgi:dipeptidyl aminopeptidase/acylaminoacyl peptidase
MKTIRMALFLAASALPSSAQQTHPFGVGDMLAMDRISDPQASPDGQWIAFTVRATDLAANRGRTDLWVAAADGSGAHRLTTHEANDSGARWMPDGRALVFLSTRGGSSQVWRLPVDGGEAAQLTSFPLDVDNVLVFPDGKRLLLTMEVEPGAATLEDTAKRDAEREASKVKARVYDSLMVRHWDTWEDSKRSHVFVWTIGGGAPIDLLKGLDVDAPTKPFGGAEELAISPDGSTVVFTAKSVGREDAWSTDLDLWLAPADGSAPGRCITEKNQALDAAPSFSPDGKWLAYLAMARPGYEADRQTIMILGLGSGGALRNLTETWDRSAGELAWSRDSRTLFTTADNVGQKSVFSVDLASGKVATVVEKGTNTNPCPVGERVVFAQDTLSGPVELCSAKLDGSDVKRLTHLNDAKVAAARMGEFEQFSFPGAKGEAVHAFVLKPADFKAGSKYPVAFLIHGGPQGSFGNHFHYRWNPQAYAGAGYAAVFVDFHGSTGYGQAFCDAIRNDWGGAPYEDLMKGLDFALAKYDFLDGSRVAALGASFGGYMINWIAGNTDRFKCLVNHDGNLDERMAYFDTEELWFPEWDHGGTPWDNPEGYTKHNPLEKVKSWKTPMLVVHGALDYRVVDTQGLSTFTVLQRRGIPSKLLYFPDENHWVLKPQNSKLWHETVIAWLDQWTQASQ